jgi:hypothetical protein
VSVGRAALPDEFPSLRTKCGSERIVVRDGVDEAALRRTAAERLVPGREVTEN